MKCTIDWMVDGIDFSADEFASLVVASGASRQRFRSPFEGQLVPGKYWRAKAIEILPEAIEIGSLGLIGLTPRNIALARSLGGSRAIFCVGFVLASDDVSGVYLDAPIVEALGAMKVSIDIDYC
jgi:hypothetical protein